MKDKKSSVSLQRKSWLQSALGAVAFGYTVLILLILYLESSGWNFGYNFEEYITQPRLSTFLVCLTLGFAARAFRVEVYAGFSTLLDIALVSKASETSPAPPKNADPASEKDKGSSTVGQSSEEDRDLSGHAKGNYVGRNLPWSVQAGVFVAVVIVLVLAFNPQIFRNLTSFKAGGFEAHFASSTQWEIQAGQIAIVNIDRKNTLRYLSRLDLQRGLIWQDNPAEDNLNRWRLKFAKLFIAKRLSPVFKRFYCIESQNIALSSTPATEIASLSNNIVNEITAAINKPNPSNMYKQLQHLGNVTEVEFVVKSLQSDINKVLGYDYNPPNKEAACAKGGDESKKDQLINFEDKELAQVRQSSALIWDPYLIRAAADLMSYSGDDRHAESLIQAAVEKEDYVRSLPIIERLALSRAHLVAMVRSNRPWPFDNMFDSMSKLLHDSRIQLDNSAADPPEEADGPETMNAYYRKARLDDLSLGLQLFYQRALIKQRFTRLQLDEWSEWLQEVRMVLGVLENVGVEIPPLRKDERKAWLSASKNIRKDGSTIQSAVTAAALSSVLLPAQTGSPTSNECLNAQHFSGQRER